MGAGVATDLPATDPTLAQPYRGSGAYRYPGGLEPGSSQDEQPSQVGLVEVADGVDKIAIERHALTPPPALGRTIG